MAWVLVALGSMWVVWLVLLHAVGFPLRGPCGSWPPWKSEHTVAVVVAVLGLIVPPILRRTPRADETLVEGRLLGAVDATILVLPVLASAFVMLCATLALLSDYHCCMIWHREPLPWWAGAHYAAAFGLGVLVALVGTRR